MKKYLLVVTLFSFCATFSYAQWITNTAGTITSTTNAIGIGTMAPASALGVNGGVSIGTYASTLAAPANGLAVSGNVSIGTTYSTYGIELGAPYAGNVDQGLRITGGPTSTLNAIRFGIKSSSGGAYRGAVTFAYNGGPDYENISLANYGFTGFSTITPTHTITLGSSGNGIAIYNTVDVTTNYEYFSEGWSGNTYILGTSAGGTGQIRNFAFMNGNLLINQTSQANSAYKLDVAGNVRANEIVVNTTGADFVFKPSYKLSSLSVVKTYIEKNHHLPGITPAKQMQADGLNVGDNQIKLLQKVEELTLYLIEKDKQINTQQQELSGLQRQIDLLKKQIEVINKKLK